ncbi:phosphoribosylformylglycinamidine synthase subunit PurQ [bacterium]|nr:phosphoribosylformylglycinamidine synthase subunit PurQ [bacterium]
MSSALSTSRSSIAVVSFPGTNCDHDLLYLIEEVTGTAPTRVSCAERELPRDLDLLFLPGGFSYGDYLRCGAMAKVSPIASAVRDFASRGGKIVGICNGFQILCELGLLPGVLLPNRTTRFLSRTLPISVDSTDSIFTAHLERGEQFAVPVAHFEGNYFAAEEELRRVEGEGQVIFRYCAPDGSILHDREEANPNGSCHSIAGVRSPSGRIVGFMPHPERVFEPSLDPVRGGGIEAGRCRRLFDGVLSAL